jgi:hypothetical protein
MAIGTMSGLWARAALVASHRKSSGCVRGDEAFAAPGLLLTGRAFFKPPGPNCGMIALRHEKPVRAEFRHARIVKRSASQAVKAGPSRRGVRLPQFIRFQLSELVREASLGTAVVARD